MKKLTEKEMILIESLECPTCKNTLISLGIELSSTEQPYPLKDDSGLDWRVKPILIWCIECKKVWLDRREDFANNIRNHTITLRDGTILPEPTASDPWKEDPTYLFSDWQHEVSQNDTRLGYHDWVMHQKEANERKCPSCGTDLTVRSSTLREYINEDDGPSIFGEGHYDNNGYYEPDSNTDLSGGRYDLCDGSDTCAACGTVVG